jgi:hypothetical protein
MRRQLDLNSFEKDAEMLELIVVFMKLFLTSARLVMSHNTNQAKLTDD